VPWYFPTPEAYGRLLAEHGFVVHRIDLIPRPTTLPVGMASWLDTFAEPFLKLLPEGQRDAAKAEAVDLLRPVLCDDAGRWVADYVRLRFSASLA
jgi:hypothetical protein